MLEEGDARADRTESRMRSGANEIEFNTMHACSRSSRGDDRGIDRNTKNTMRTKRLRLYFSAPSVNLP